jgi:hypothetical protein
LVAYFEITAKELNGKTEEIKI